MAERAKNTPSSEALDATCRGQQGSRAFPVTTEGGCARQTKAFLSDCGTDQRTRGYQFLPQIHQIFSSFSPSALVEREESAATYLPFPLHWKASNTGRAPKVF